MPEEILTEFSSFDAPPVQPLDASPKAKESNLADKITDITQLPSIWSLEQDIKWLIDGIIPLASVNLITSESGVGKTWLAYAIAGTVARGEPFGGRRVKQRPVLYLDGENPLSVAKKRLHDLGIAETADLRVWGGWIPEQPHGPASPLLRGYANAHKPLLIWDSLVHFHDGEEQSATETRKFMNCFRMIANLGATVLILHHTGKTSSSQEYRGSSDIKAAVDTAYLLESVSTLNGNIHRLTLRNFKGRFAPGCNLGLEFVPRQGFIAYEPANRHDARDAMQTVIEIVKANPGCNQTQIVKLTQAAEISKHQAEKCLENGPFHRERGKGKEILYTLAEQRIPVIPVPIEREDGISTAPAEEVA